MKEDVELFILLSSLSIICYCILFVLPVFILQENYLKYNKEIELILLNDHIEINKEVIKIEFIKEVNIYATHQYFSGYVGATALIYNEYFYYMEIITYENRRYILTSLLGIELDEVIRKTYPELTFNEKVHWFPLINN